MIARPDDPEAVRRLLEERAAALARPAELEERGELVGVLGLVAGNERYAVLLGAVVGIEPLLEIARVPGVPAFWAGLGNVRGRLYPVLDLVTYLGLSPQATAGQRKVVLVSAAGIDAGLLADDVSDVTWIRRDDIRTAPVGRRDRQVALHGVTSDLVAVLDVESLLTEPALTVDDEGI